MTAQERLERAKEILGTNIRIANHNNVNIDTENDVSRHFRYNSCEKKNRFRNEAEARHSAKVIFRENGVKMRVYFCELCNGYHLTTIVKGQKRISKKETQKKTRISLSQMRELKAIQENKKRIKR